jgi:uncharacterized protein YkwD
LKHANVVFVLVLLALCATPAVAAASATPEQRMVNEINTARAKQGGLPPLRAARDLQRSATAFARWLLTHDQFQHRPSVSVTRNYHHCGEALAQHYSLQAEVGGTLGTWLGSPSHRALVLTNSMNLVGVGHASGRPAGRPRTVWVMQVARR